MTQSTSAGGTLQRLPSNEQEKEFRPATCLICKHDRGVGVEVNSLDELREHEKEHEGNNSCWSTDWEGYWK